VIQLTAKGRRLEATIYASAGAAELRIAEILGPQRFAQLQSSLELLTEQLEGSPTVLPQEALSAG
jgi:DNA-binding MarR family transcriptional regulator